MRTPIKRRRGAAMLVNMISIALLMGVMATSFALLSATQMANADSYRSSSQAMQLATAKANEIAVISYDRLTSTAAASRATIPGADSWQREVIVAAAETSLAGGNAQREVTVNVYYGSETYPRATLTNAFAASETQLPYGAVVSWAGAAASIPYGWALCNGANGTPDLRDRFVVGAGLSYAVGNIGGEASHRLTIAEMPNHRHGLSLFYTGPGFNDAYWASFWNGTVGYTDIGGDNFWGAYGAGVDYNGGGQAHNNLPPYYALCYIMKVI